MLWSRPFTDRRTRSAPYGADRPRLHSQERDTDFMRLTIFWERMADHFGSAYAESFARDHVMAELGGRTVHEALDAGWEAKDVWRAVCTAMGVPADKR